MINRNAIVLAYRKPFVDWIKSVAGAVLPVESLRSLGDERRVYLAETEGKEPLAAWLQENYDLLLEEELEHWCADAALWPADRGYQAFYLYFDVKLSDSVRDTGYSAIIDREV